MILVCGYTYFNDAIIGQNYIIGNHLPAAVIGGLILFLLIVNGGLYLLCKRFAMTGPEMTVVFTMVLAACCIPSSGLMRTFTTNIVLPHHYNETEVGWKEGEVLDMLPPVMLVDPGDNSDEVVKGFLKGMGHDDTHIAVSDVPWYAWRRTLSFWIPMILVVWIGLIALATVVHRQWAVNEQLPYPLATFFNALMPGKSGRLAGLLRNPTFWISAGVVLFIHMNNYTYNWFPDHMKVIPTEFNFKPLVDLIGPIKDSGSSWIVNMPIFFCVVGVAFFLAADVSFAVGIGPYVFLFIIGLSKKYGYTITSSLFEPNQTSGLLAGAFGGMFLVLLYTGRRYYALVARCLFKRTFPDEIDDTSVWGARVAIVCALAFAAMLTGVGLDWQLAVMYTIGLYIIFLVMGRLIAETGVFFMQPWWWPGVFILSVFGYQALGPETCLIMFMVSTVLMIDPREALMPFIVNCLKQADMQKLNLKKMSGTWVFALCVGLAVAVPTTLYFQYDRGANTEDGWATHLTVTQHFMAVNAGRKRLESQERLVSSRNISGWKRFTEISPHRPTMIGATIGLVLVLLCTVGRLKFSRWPLHPVLFLVWCSPWAGKVLALPFLVGWFIKVIVSKYGGAAGYEKTKPFMYGLIAGDVLAAVIMSIVSLIYYWITGEKANTIWLMPG